MSSRQCKLYSTMKQITLAELIQGLSGLPSETPVYVFGETDASVGYYMVELQYGKYFKKSVSLSADEDHYVDMQRVSRKRRHS